MSVKYKYGLVVRPTYDELMNQILDGDIIKPKKDINLFDATWLANTQEMSQFMKDSIMDLQNQESQILKSELMEMKVKEIAKDTGIPAPVVRAVAKKKTPPETMYYDMAAGDKYDKAPEEALQEMEIEEQNRKRQAQEKFEKIKKCLKNQYLKLYQKISFIKWFHRLLRLLHQMMLICNTN